MYKKMLVVIVFLYLVCTDVYASECVLKDEFDSDVAGSTPSYWTAPDSSKIPVYKIVTQSDLVTNRYLEITKNTGNTSQKLVRTFEDAVTGSYIEATMKVKMKQLNNAGEQAYFAINFEGDSETTGASQTICGFRIYNTYMMANGINKPRVEITRVGESWVPIDSANAANPSMTADQFIDVKVLVNTVDKKYRISVGSVNWPADTAAGMQWYAISASNYPGAMKLKRISVSTNLSWSTNAVGVDSVKTVTNHDFVPEAVISNAQGTTLTKLVNGTVSGTVYAKNLNDEDRPITLVLSLYKDGILQDFTYNAVNIPAGTDARTPVKASLDIYAEDLTGYYLQTYIINRFDSLMPLAPPKELRP